MCYCSDIFGLFNKIGIDYNPQDWRLFIDSSVKSLKAVLLYNGNKFPSIPVGHSVHMKEEYENVKALLDMINYSSYNWELCGDFQDDNIVTRSAGRVYKVFMLSLLME